MIWPRKEQGLDGAVTYVWDKGMTKSWVPEATVQAQGFRKATVPITCSFKWLGLYQSRTFFLKDDEATVVHHAEQISLAVAHNAEAAICTLAANAKDMLKTDKFPHGPGLAVVITDHKRHPTEEYWMRDEGSIPYMFGAYATELTEFERRTRDMSARAVTAVGITLGCLDRFILKQSCLWAVSDDGSVVGLRDDPFMRITDLCGGPARSADAIASAVRHALDVYAALPLNIATLLHNGDHAKAALEQFVYYFAVLECLITVTFDRLDAQQVTLTHVVPASLASAKQWLVDNAKKRNQSLMTKFAWCAVHCWQDVVSDTEVQTFRSLKQFRDEMYHEGLAALDAQQHADNARVLVARLLRLQLSRFKASAQGG